MARVDLKKIMEWLAHVLRCPICGQKYSLDQTKIVDSKDDKLLSGANLLVHTDCERCKSSVVFSIAIDGPEIFSVGMVTDLTSRDIKRFRNTPALKPEDVLSLHGFLDSFDGDFRKLVG